MVRATNSPTPAVRRAAMPGLVLVLAALCLGGGAAQARPGAAATPEAFAQRLVARLPRSEVPAGWYDPSLRALQQANTRIVTQGLDEDDLDYDMLLQGQDFGSHYELRGLRRLGNGHVELRLRGGGSEGDYSVILSQVGGEWRIWDVVDRQMGSERAYYARRATCVRTTHGDDAYHACIHRR
jgi:hypothetical protein